MKSLILGSSSPFRAALLSKLGLPFESIAADIDETAHENESADQLVQRLSRQKAQKIAITYPNALIIGSDQVAVLNNQILGKPGNHENAVKQLKACSGKTVRFLTGLSLLNSQTKHCQTIIEPFDVIFRELSPQQITFYLQQEQPYDCAGSFKSEGFGISLFKKLAGDDPNSLIGLPLIRLVEMLLVEGIDVLHPTA